MVRMPWLKMRLALALVSLPGAALSLSACGPGQAATPEPDKPKPVIENKVDPDEKLPEPELPPLTADQWCGSADEAMAARAGYRGDNQPCPTTTYYDGYDWNRDAQNGQLRTDRTGETVCCYERDPYGGQVYEGRPLLVDGHARTAPATTAGAWAPRELIDVTIADNVPRSLRDEVVRRWVGNGLLEHASVASFARATIELMALGAPPSLVAAAQRAASDEIRHAQMCFALASSYADAPVGPGPLAPAAPRALDLAGLAATTFVEGCVSESIGALECERLAQRARHPLVRRLLRDIAADEARHAELAWSTVGWAVRTGGKDVLDAVVEAARAYELPAICDDRPDDDTLEACGVAGDAERARAMHRGWQELVLPLLDELVAGRAVAAGVPNQLGV